jgi:hypothetical protein
MLVIGIDLWKALHEVIQTFSWTPISATVVESSTVSIQRRAMSSKGAPSVNSFYSASLRVEYSFNGRAYTARLFGGSTSLAQIAKWQAGLYTPQTQAPLRVDPANPSNASMMADTSFRSLFGVWYVVAKEGILVIAMAVSIWLARRQGRFPASGAAISGT